MQKGFGSQALKLLEDYYLQSASKASVENVSSVNTMGVNVIDDTEVYIIATYFKIFLKQSLYCSFHICFFGL